MNTHDKYKLPPFPSPFGIVDPDGTERMMQYTIRDLQDYAKSYARTAIAPYAQRISELESQLEAIGAGGVDGRRITSTPSNASADRKRRGEPVAWLYEDELPDNYPYDTMFPYSKVDGVRMFPVDAPQPAEPRLDAPAQVGPVRFGIGVKWSNVIRAAQRHHEYMRQPEQEQARMKKFGEAIKAIQPVEPVEVPSPHEFNTGNEKLDALLDDTFYLAKDGGMDNAIKWQESLEEFLASIEPVKEPPCET